MLRHSLEFLVNLIQCSYILYCYFESIKLFSFQKKKIWFIVTNKNNILDLIFFLSFFFLLFLLTENQT